MRDLDIIWFRFKKPVNKLWTVHNVTWRQNDDANNLKQVFLKKIGKNQSTTQVWGSHDLWFMK